MSSMLFEAARTADAIKLAEAIHCRSLQELINLRDHYGSSLLHVAVLSASYECVQLLLEAGFPVNECKDGEKMTALQRACQTDKAEYVSCNCEEDCLRAAEQEKHEAAAGGGGRRGDGSYTNHDRMGKSEQDGDDDSDDDEGEGQQQQKMTKEVKHSDTCSINRSEIVKLLLDYDADIDEHESGLNALHIAAMYDEEGIGDVCKVLIEAGADANQRDIHGKLPEELTAHAGLKAMLSKEKDRCIRYPPRQKLRSRNRRNSNNNKYHYKTESGCSTSSSTSLTENGRVDVVMLKSLVQRKSLSEEDTEKVREMMISALRDKHIDSQIAGFQQQERALQQQEQFASRSSFDNGSGGGGGCGGGGDSGRTSWSNPSRKLSSGGGSRRGSGSGSGDGEDSSGSASRRGSGLMRRLSNNIHHAINSSHCSDGFSDSETTIASYPPPPPSESGSPSTTTTTSSIGSPQSSNWSLSPVRLVRRGSLLKNLQHHLGGSGDSRGVGSKGKGEGRRRGSGGSGSGSSNLSPQRSLSWRSDASDGGGGDFSGGGGGGGTGDNDVKRPKSVNSVIATLPATPSKETTLKIEQGDFVTQKMHDVGSGIITGIEVVAL